MSDTALTILVVLGCVAFVGLYCFFHFVVPRLVERFARRLSGVDVTSSWQPHLRAQAAWLATLLAAAPFVGWCVTAGPMTTWPTFRGILLYGAYLSLLLTVGLILSAFFPPFQRFAFRQQPVPPPAPRRFAVGIVFFFLLSIAFSYAATQAP